MKDDKKTKIGCFGYLAVVAIVNGIVAIIKIFAKKKA